MSRSASDAIECTSANRERPIRVDHEILGAMMRAQILSAYVRQCYVYLQKVVNGNEKHKSPLKAKNDCLCIGRRMIALRWGLRLQSNLITVFKRDEEQMCVEDEVGRQYLASSLRCLEQCQYWTKELAVRLYVHYCTQRLSMTNAAYVEQLDRPQRSKILDREYYEHFPNQHGFEGWERWIAEGL